LIVSEPSEPKVREVLRAKKLTQRELARRAGISEAQLSQILSATGNPTVRTLARIADAMDRRLWIRFEPNEPQPLSEQERGLCLAA
jgi:transcriptional regulator with XRE-family HTH domain